MATPKETSYININGQTFPLHTDPRLLDMIMTYLAATISGDATLAAGGALTIATGVIGVTDLDPALLKYLLEYASVDYSRVDYCLLY